MPPKRKCSARGNPAPKAKRSRSGRVVRAPPRLAEVEHQLENNPSEKTLPSPADQSIKLVADGTAVGGPRGMVDPPSIPSGNSINQNGEGEPPVHPLCGPCSVKNKSKQNAQWKCEDCEEYLCGDCKAWHGMFKGNAAHTVKRVDMSKLGMASTVRHGSDFEGFLKELSLDPNCGPCCVKGEPERKATSHCVECEEYFCEECKVAHGTFKSNKSHNVEDVQSKLTQSHARLEQANPGENFCTRHKNNPILYFCTTDGEYCCSQCYQEGHKGCESIVYLSKKPKLKLVRDFDVSFPGDEHTPYIRGAAYLPDGRLVLTDEDNKKMKVFGTDFKLLYGKDFQQYPYNVAVYEEDEVAVTFPKAKQIIRLSAKKPIKEKKTITTGCEPHGIAYIDKSRILVSDTESNTLNVFSVEGPQLLVISNEDVDVNLSDPFYCCLDVSKSIAYASNSTGHSVSAINLKTKAVMFHCKDKRIDGPTGICTDSFGRIYVACHTGIIAISRDGIVIGTLYPWENFIGKKETIAISPDNKQLILTYNRNFQAQVLTFES